jgi:hypothetical protein
VVFLLESVVFALIGLQLPIHTVREVRRALVATEAGELLRMYEEGEISGTTMRRLRSALDLERASLGEH